MAATDFATLPVGMPGKPVPFSLQIPDQDLAKFRDLVRVSKVGPPTWWNKQNDRQFGITREWLAKGKEAWLNDFDWRKHERNINSFPNFKIGIDDLEVGRTDVHFGALFSTKKDAIPVILMHLNAEDKVSSIEALTPDERKRLERSKEWQTGGMAYASEHGTRPATIRLVLSSSPLAMLAWIGEKFLEWSDTQNPLPLDTILFMGGHFAALEQPQAFLEDIEEFIAKISWSPNV
ncbi:hypothetical protein QQX98_003634 [Neonectria punicea]|uniref:Epoxide hydrolase N-terminal domain-containing protein n=1 Tax=Neonectria punicea TaxID=979145 RepID=A0ABR1HCY3_9HYPO